MRRPNGAFYVYANVTSTGLTASEFCLRLLEEGGVMIFPGSLFGDHCDDYVRISLLQPLPRIEEADAPHGGGRRPASPPLTLPKRETAMNAPVKIDNPNVVGIKHMAFAVKDAKAALAAYSRFLCVPGDTPIIEYAKSRNRVAIFILGGIEYQLCQSMDADGPLRDLDQGARRRGPASHLLRGRRYRQGAASRQANGASLRVCKSCKVVGSHPHPEGYVAFLDNDAGGIEIEFMQVYTPEELEKYNAVKGI